MSNKKIIEIKLTHAFLKNCFDLNGLLKDVKTLNKFKRNLEKQSGMYPDRYSPDNYKGDGFEMFTEALIKTSLSDKRIGISNYRIWPADDDYGIDGSGIGIDGYPVTVQVKFRSDPNYMLTANDDGLNNFENQSNKYIKKVFSEKPGNENASMDSYNKLFEIRRKLIVTTGKGVNNTWLNKMTTNPKSVAVLGYYELRQLVDGNIMFWNNFRKLCGVESE